MEDYGVVKGDIEVVGFYRGVQGGSAEGNAAFAPMTDFCKSYWKKHTCKEHFNDFYGIDISSILVRNNFDSLLDNPGVTGFTNIVSGRNPRRYMLEIAVSEEDFSGESINIDAMRDFYADSIEQAFEACLEKAVRVKGRLIDKENTRRVLFEFLTTFRQQAFQLDLNFLKDSKETEAILREIENEIQNEDLAKK